MRNRPARMGHDPDPLSFDARVNATKIVILILMDRDPISLLRVNGILDMGNSLFFASSSLKHQII